MLQICEMSDDEREMTLNEVYKNIKDLIKETSHDIKTEIVDIKTQLHQVEEKVTILDNQDKRNREQLMYLQRELRKNNLVIFGLAENDEEDLIDKVLELFTENLKVKVSISEINQVYRFGQKNGVRPILVKLVTLHKKFELLKQGVLLKNTNIFIANDLIKEDREKQKILRKHLKIARAENVDARIIKNRLLINDVLFTTDQLIAISEQGNTNTNTESKELVQNNNNKGKSISKPLPTQGRQKNKFKQANIDTHTTNFSSYITRAKKIESSLRAKK